MSRPVFLHADWRYLVVANYSISPAILEQFCPAGVELDPFEGEYLASVVGFLFLNTRVAGLRIPFHTDFEEVNLRFYVRREEAGELRRGVAFVKEIVPRRAIATVARLLYNERYVAMPMGHHLRLRDATLAPGSTIAYGWRPGQRWEALRARIAGEASLPPPRSQAAFVTEHYWGYARQRDGGTVEYEVRHPPWRTWAVDRFRLEADVARLYGKEFAEPLAQGPVSVFVAEGSAVTVHRGRRLPRSG